jgi:hypothetical protein
LYSILAEDTRTKTGAIWWGPIWEGRVAYLWDFLVIEKKLAFFRTLTLTALCATGS